MTLLAILAHPDDESFFCGGNLARYAALGHRVCLICATRGEQGEILHPEIDPVLYPKGQARGRLREGELNQACRILGIEPLIVLDYQDSGHRGRLPAPGRRASGSLSGLLPTPGLGRGGGGLHVAPGAGDQPQEFG